MSELIYCPECGHPKWDKNHSNCTYESLVGEKRTLMQCIHCKLISSDNNPVEECKVSACHDWGVFTPDAEPEPSLSLLVIDLGDSCVVKEERGQLPNLPESIGVITHGDSHTGDTFLVSTDFPELRSAIDGERPVPRIERGNGGGYRLFDCNDKFGHELCEDAFRVYQETVGKPLPIYECGKWERLDGKFNPMDAYGELPVKVWRYRRD